jgi:hypothetical protein
MKNILLSVCTLLPLLAAACTQENEPLTRPVMSVSADVPSKPTPTLVPADPSAWSLAYCSYREERQILLQYNYDAFGTVEGLTLDKRKSRAAELHPRNKAVMSQFVERLTRLSVPEGAQPLHKAELDLAAAVNIAIDQVGRSIQNASTVSDIETATAKFDAYVQPYYDAMAESNQDLSADVILALRTVRKCGNDKLHEPVR